MPKLVKLPVRYSAIAGGISIQVLQKKGYLYEPGGICSADGHCRAFDAKAGIVVLKRLEKAIADGDCIYAVIKGSAINNDGAIKVGFTAPSIDGQASAIVEAMNLAEIAPETISYIEAHGTQNSFRRPHRDRSIKISGERLVPGFVKPFL